MKKEIINTILAHYAQAQAIYLFGSHGTDDEWPDSDVDVALLLPPEQAKAEQNLLLSQCRFDLEDALRKQGVITAELAENLRRMVRFGNTVTHQYQRLDLTIVQTVIVSGLDDLIEFGDCVLEFIQGPPS
jgi:predicted nucleotidyltransferase